MAFKEGTMGVFLLTVLLAQTVSGNAAVTFASAKQLVQQTRLAKETALVFAGQVS